jgi:hypothetical protein
MLLIYVDNILSISHCARETIKEVISYYKAKEGSIKEPDCYLGADVAKLQLPDGQIVWSNSLRSYAKNAVDVVKHLLSEDGEGNSLESRVKNPFPSGYMPELGVTDELGPELAS